jgi:hypothetical protein
MEFTPPWIVYETQAFETSVPADPGEVGVEVMVQAPSSGRLIDSGRHSGASSRILNNLHLQQPLCCLRRPWSSRRGLRTYTFKKISLCPTVLPRGRNFGRIAKKRAEKKLAGPGKSGAELLPDLSKKGRKGAKLFSSLVFHKIVYFSCSKDFTYKLLIFLSVLTTLDLEPLKKLQN